MASDKPQPPDTIYARWFENAGHWVFIEPRHRDKNWIRVSDDDVEYVPASQRDELRAACEALIAYRDRVGPLYFQLEKADDYIRMMRLAVEKVRGPDE